MVGRRGHRGTPPRPLSSMIQQLQLPHWRLTQRGWTNFNSPGNAALSVILLLLLYLGPGMFKTVLTLRTGNAWVHVWAYHALAPHVLQDTPLMVKIFRIT
jgi:hypothetical protein